MTCTDVSSFRRELWLYSHQNRFPLCQGMKTANLEIIPSLLPCNSNKRERTSQLPANALHFGHGLGARRHIPYWLYHPWCSALSALPWPCQCPTYLSITATALCFSFLLPSHYAPSPTILPPRAFLSVQLSKRSSCMACLDARALFISMLQLAFMHPPNLISLATEEGPNTFSGHQHLFWEEAQQTLSRVNSPQEQQ